MRKQNQNVVWKTGRPTQIIEDFIEMSVLSGKVWE